MASPQKENGYTPIANELMEAIYKTNFTATEFKIILLVSRFTYGFSRHEHDFSLMFISNAIGISKRYVAISVSKLIEDNILIVVNEHTMTASRTIKFNKDYEQWSRTRVPQMNHSSPVEPQFHTPVEPQFHTPVEPQFHQDKQDFKTNNKTNNKTINNKEENIAVFYPLDAKLNDAFLEFVLFRKKIRAPMTEHAIALMIKKLDGMTDSNDEKIEILEQSILNSWKGIFELKNRKANPKSDGKADYNDTVNRMLERTREKNGNGEIFGIS